MRLSIFRTLTICLVAVAFALPAGCGGSSAPGEMCEAPSGNTEAEMEVCDGACVDLQSNVNNCGECGNSCGAAGFWCNDGICECTSSKTEPCGNRCVDTSSNLDHCGACGKSCDSGETCDEGTCRTRTAIEAVIRETNEVRSTSTDCENGFRPSVPPLTGNAELHEAAQMHSDRMAKKDFFAHTDPHNMTNFADRIEMTDYSGSPVGENIAYGYGEPAAAVEGWRTSKTGHCSMMMTNRADEIGIGYTVAESGANAGTPYWVQVFGASGGGR
jgi:uncharacterized protein YkwD